MLKPAAHLAGAVRQVALWTWPLVQTTAAATLAWTIARLVGGGDDPFFAPIAAVVALSQQLGERGSTAVRLLLGVILGIVAGELTLLWLESGWGSLALALFTAMVMARALGAQRVVIVQAAAAAILTVAVGDGEAGVHRLANGLIGGGVALVFSQILFSPQPLAMLRRAEAVALADMAQGLRMTADALDNDDDALGNRAIDRLRELRDQLAELARVRRVSGRVARRSAAWRSQRRPLVSEQENAGHLDLLGGSCVVLARAATAASDAERRALAPHVRAIAEAVQDLSLQPGDRATRQSAAEDALGVIRRLARLEAPREPFAGAITGMRLVATDLMSFTGVDPDRALEVVRDATGELNIPPPPPTQRAPFLRERRQPPG